MYAARPVTVFAAWALTDVTPVILCVELARLDIDQIATPATHVSSARTSPKLAYSFVVSETVLMTRTVADPLGRVAPLYDRRSTRGIGSPPANVEGTDPGLGTVSRGWVGSCVRDTSLPRDASRRGINDLRARRP